MVKFPLQDKIVLLYFSFGMKYYLVDIQLGSFHCHIFLAFLSDVFTEN